MRTLLVLAALSLVACDSTDLSASGDIVASLDGGIVILQTVEEFGCANYPLVLETTSQSNQIDVTILGVDTNVNVCQRAFGPARGSIAIPLAALGTVEIRIRQGAQRDRLDFACVNDACRLTARGDLTFVRIAE